jgi:pimeloyl-ACP methyl ester carboxylesterase
MREAEWLGDGMRLSSLRTSDDLTLRLRNFGFGTRTAVLVHGFADGAYVWEPCMRSLAGTFRTHAVDLRGHGDSDWDDPSRYDVETHTADVNQLVNEISEPGIVLIGHSMGGNIATRIAALRPERIDALVLVDFGPALDRDAGRRGRENLRESLRLYDTTDSYAQWLLNSRPLVSTELLQHLAVSALRPVEGGFRLKVDPALLDADDVVAQQNDSALWQMLDSIRCPTLIVRGAGSAMFMRAAAESMAMRMQHSRLATIGCAGHAVMTDNPSDFNRVLAAFLASTGTRSI